MYYKQKRKKQMSYDQWNWYFNALNIIQTLKDVKIYTTTTFFLVPMPTEVELLLFISADPKYGGGHCDDIC